MAPRETACFPGSRNVRGTDVRDSSGPYTVGERRDSPPTETAVHATVESAFDNKYSGYRVFYFDSIQRLSKLLVYFPISVFKCIRQRGTTPGFLYLLNPLCNLCGGNDETHLSPSLCVAVSVRRSFHRKSARTSRMGTRGANGGRADRRTCAQGLQRISLRGYVE